MLAQKVMQFSPNVNDDFFCSPNNRLIFLLLIIDLCPVNSVWALNPNEAAMMRMSS